MDKIRIKLFDILLALSGAVDLVAPELFRHHQKVACLAYRLAEQMNLSEQTKRDTLIGGMLHDIGAFTLSERLALLDQEPLTVNSHAFRGANLLSEYKPFASVSEAVRYHHIPWESGRGRNFRGKEIPTASHLLHLADRACVMINPRNDILSQIPEMLNRLKARENHLFMPQATDALVKLSTKEHIWLELTYAPPQALLCDLNSYCSEVIDIDEVLCLSKIISRVIDFRSKYTANHSAGVAKTAEKLGQIAGFSETECKMLKIAGYLHDLGKLAIADTILEKPASLSAKEFNVIRSHSYLTYKLLEGIEGFDTISKWASFHHEKLNGTGYPFHLKGENIPLGSRIIAVADIFAAVTEYRPYRKGMEKDQVVSVLRSMVEDGSICLDVVTMLLTHFNLFTEICKISQQEALADYDLIISEQYNRKLFSRVCLF